MSGTRLPFIFDDFLKLGEAHPHQAEVDKRTSESGNGDLANILYTSGTTGDSKGVMLHHSCYEAAIPAHDERFPQLGDQDVIMNFLPFTHVFERAWTCWCPFDGMYFVYQLASC